MRAWGDVRSRPTSTARPRTNPKPVTRAKATAGDPVRAAIAIMRYTAAVVT
jgi:hypothetical protein